MTPTSAGNAFERIHADLAANLEREIACLDQLQRAMLAQRHAVSINDREEVDRTVTDIAALMVSLRDAREDREALVGTLLLPDEKLREYLARVPFAPRGLKALADALHHKADSLTRDAEINRRVLLATINSGEAFLRSVIDTAAARQPCYPDALPAAAAGEPMFFNRTA